jgi:hypothetical protein
MLWRCSALFHMRGMKVRIVGQVGIRARRAPLDAPWALSGLSLLVALSNRDLHIPVLAHLAAYPFRRCRPVLRPWLLNPLGKLPAVRPMDAVIALKGLNQRMFLGEMALIARGKSEPIRVFSVTGS